MLDFARPPSTLVPSAVAPAVPFRQAILVALSAGLGYGFDSYAVNIFGMLSPLIRKDLGMSIGTIGTIGSIFLIGYTLGTIGFGWLADKVGRRDALRFSILLYGATTALGGLVSGVVAMAVLRFLTGLGGAGELAVGAPYTAEVWPKHLRALGTGGIMFSLFAVGFILAAIVSLLVVPTFGWRSAFLFAAVPAGLLLWLRQAVGDSPRFEALRGDLERASADDATRRPPERIWAIPGARRRLAIGWLLYVANACGYWGITFFLTTFMIQKFHLTARQSIFWAMIFYGAQAVLSLVGTYASDRVGRRPAGIAGALLMIAFTAAATTTDSFPLFAVFGALMIGMLGWLWGIGDTYLSEFFRTSLRGTGFGIMVGGGRLVSIAAPFLVGWGISVYGPTLPFLATSGLWVLTIIGYWMGPETAGRDLEAVQL